MDEERMMKWIAAAERMQLAEYVRFQSDRKRRLADAFLQGIFRGLGAMVGFAVVGTLLLMLLKNATEKNLPQISAFFEYLMTLIERKMQ